MFKQQGDDFFSGLAILGRGFGRKYTNEKNEKKSNQQLTEQHTRNLELATIKAKGEQWKIIQQNSFTESQATKKREYDAKQNAYDRKAKRDEKPQLTPEQLRTNNLAKLDSLALKERNAGNSSALNLLGTMFEVGKTIPALRSEIIEFEAYNIHNLDNKAIKYMDVQTLESTLRDLDLMRQKGYVDNDYYNKVNRALYNKKNLTGFKAFFK